MNFFLGIILLVSLNEINCGGLTRNDCTCGDGNIPNSGRIVNGLTTTPNKYPWQAAQFTENGFMCGGSVISDKNILTAGHCVFYVPDVYATYWVLGMHDSIQQDGTRYEIQNYALHPYFHNHSVYDDYDMAMITVRGIIQFNWKVHPICLTTTRDDYTGRKVIVSGWGRLGDWEKAGLGTKLQETKVRVKTTMQCVADTQHLLKFNPSSMLCAHEKNTDACNGDSGGPLFTETHPNRYELIGVVSFGEGCARNFPGIYGRLSDPFTNNWIKQFILGSQGNVCKDPAGKITNFFSS